jgi:pimeloyl-ACP methyl ester carboxylesterase
MTTTSLRILFQIATIRPRTFVHVSRQTLWFCFLAAAFICGSGCTAVQAPRQHVVLVNRSGKSMFPEGPRARKVEEPDDFVDHLRSITNAIANCTDCVGGDGAKRILIFVHGGLNTYNQSLERVKERIPRISAAGYYPLFINWNSGLVSSYREHLLITRQGRVERVWGPVTAPFYLVADLGRAITRAPVVWYYQLTSDATTAVRYETPKIVRKALFLKGQSASEDSTQSRAESLQISIGRDKRSDLNRVLNGTAYFVTLPLKLVVAPFIDAFGKSAWDNMSRRTQTMFWDPKIFRTLPQETQIRDAVQRVASQPDGSGTVAQLVRRLADLIEADRANHRYEITLIGHSMGTIVANEIIRTHPELPYANIVYMGAACSVSDFEKTMVPYLQKSTNAQFYNLTLHPIAEAREAQWFLLDIPPRGSLLEWIDNFLASPRTVPERTLGKWENVIATSVLIPKEIAGRVHIKAFDVGAGKTDNPEKHGAFSEQDFWKEEYWTAKPR